MAEGKYTKIGGAIKQIVAEYTKIGGAIKQGTVNCPKIGGAIKSIAVGEVAIFICEQFSDRLYAIDNDQANLDGWPNYGDPGGGTITNPVVVACDEDGNSYWGCETNVYKYNLAGEWQWTYTGHTSAIYSIAVCREGGTNYIYTGDYDGTIKRLLGPFGVVAELWTYDLPGTVASIAVDDSAGYVYAGTGNAADEVWGASLGAGNFTRRWISKYGDVAAIAIDEGIPSLYVGTNGMGVYPYDQVNLAKISVNGYEYWTTDKNGFISAVHVGHDGYGYYSNGSSEQVGKFILSTGTPDVWTYNPAGAAWAMSCAIDEYGHVFATYKIAGSSAYNKVYKLNSSGVEVWDWQPYLAAQMRGIAVRPGIKAAGY